MRAEGFEFRALGVSNFGFRGQAAEEQQGSCPGSPQNPGTWGFEVSGSRYLGLGFRV